MHNVVYMTVMRLLITKLNYHFAPMAIRIMNISLLLLLKQNDPGVWARKRCARWIRIAGLRCIYINWW